MVPDDIANCQTGSKNPYIWFSAQKNERPSYPILMRSKVKYWPGTPNSLRKVFNLTPFVSKRLPLVFSSAYFSNKLCFDWGDFLFSPTSLFFFNWKSRCWQHLVSEVQAVLSSHFRTIHLQKFWFHKHFLNCQLPVLMGCVWCIDRFKPTQCFAKIQIKIDELFICLVFNEKL